MRYITILTIIICIFVLGGLASGFETTGGQRVMEESTLFTNQYLAAGGATNSSAVGPLYASTVGDKYTLYVSSSGSGTLKFESWVSEDGTTYAQPTAFGNINSTIGATLAAGNHTLSFELPLCKYFKIEMTEDGSSNNATANATALWR